ncbi:MAG: class I SAM-dependent methyltransferase [Deltaproteobacteria bacterium]|nr:class I SAM-dependent methyltransferase [Deltaproteobacteria bacterium]
MTLEIQRSAQGARAPQIDLNSIKARQKATWGSGNYAIIGTTLQIVGESLCEAADVRAGEQVLDIACGNGNAALAAARRWARVTGVDYVPELLGKARERAQADGVTITLREADAEALPFADRSFEVVLSTFGVMFAPNHVAAASEILRVCRPGGRIGLACWTPEGFVGQMLGVVGRHVPPPAGLMPPSLWGKKEHLAALLGDGVSKMEIERKHFKFRYESAAHFIEIFSSYYGPMHKAFGALDDSGQKSLTQDLEALIHRFDEGGGRSLVVPGEYLEVVAVRR